MTEVRHEEPADNFAEGGGQISTEELQGRLLDLRDVPLSELKILGGEALANEIETYRKRILEDDMPLSSFNARI